MTSVDPSDRAPRLGGVGLAVAVAAAALGLLSARAPIAGAALSAAAAAVAVALGAARPARVVALAGGFGAATGVGVLAFARLAIAPGYPGLSPWILEPLPVAGLGAALAAAWTAADLFRTRRPGSGAAAPSRATAGSPGSPGS